MDLMTKRVEEQHMDDVFASEEQFYLLDREFCIVNAHTCVENCENTVCGASFFDLFPTGRAVREEIDGYVRSYPQKTLLTLCGRTPVLFAGTLASHTGLVLAAIPVGEVKRALAFPAAFHHVPSCVSVSSSAQLRYKMHGEEAFATACRWLLRVSEPFVCFAGAQRTLSAVLHTAAERFSAFFGVPIACDLGGLPALSCEGVELPFAVGVMLAALAAARRSGAEAGVHLYAAMEGAPTLYLEYTRFEGVEQIPEFSSVLSCAAARGMSLDVVCPSDDPHRVQIRACIGTVELSAQGVRERYHFLEGKSPLCILPQPRAVSLPFAEIFLDE